MNRTRHIQSYSIISCLKLIAVCLVLCLAVQSCRQETHPLIPEGPEEVAISMNATSVEAMEPSRALIEDDSHLQGAGFTLYGYKTTVANVITQLFTGQGVTYDATKATWDYAPKRYWDRTATYNFGAYAPTTLPANLTVAHDENQHTLTFTLPNWQVVDKGATDLVVATSSDEATDYLETYSGTVDLAFDHVLSCFEVQLKKAESLVNTYTLCDLTYKNVPKDEESSTYTLDYATASNSTMGTVTLGSKAVCSDAKLPVGTGMQKSPAVTFSHLLVPFTGSDKVTLSVTYIAGLGAVADGHSFEYTRDITTDLTQMQAGKKYVLTLTFTGGGEIVPELSVADWSIAKWNDQDIEEEDKYNW